MPIIPSIDQLRKAKQACPEALLLFRIGDFYEAFHEDAEKAAGILNLSLTSRRENGESIQVMGFPFFHLEENIHKLVAAGVRVAVCELIHRR